MSVCCHLYVRWPYSRGVTQCGDGSWSHERAHDQQATSVSQELFFRAPQLDNASRVPMLIAADRWLICWRAPLTKDLICTVHGLQVCSVCCCMVAGTASLASITYIYIFYGKHVYLNKQMQYLMAKSGPKTKIDTCHATAAVWIWPGGEPIRNIES